MDLLRPRLLERLLPVASYEPTPAPTSSSRGQEGRLCRLGVHTQRPRGSRLPSALSVRPVWPGVWGELCPRPGDVGRRGEPGRSTYRSAGVGLPDCRAAAGLGDREEPPAGSGRRWGRRRVDARAAGEEGRRPPLTSAGRHGGGGRGGRRRGGGASALTRSGAGRRAEGAGVTPQ